MQNSIGCSKPQMDIMDPTHVVTRDAKLWLCEKVLYVEHHVKLMQCPCQICKGNKQHIRVEKVGNYLVVNGRHHPFIKLRAQVHEANLMMNGMPMYMVAEALSMDF